MGEGEERDNEGERRGVSEEGKERDEEDGNGSGVVEWYGRVVEDCVLL